jgi:hypothetical protein
MNLRASAREALLPTPVGARRFLIRATHERGVGVPSSRSLATATREARSLYGNEPTRRWTEDTNCEEAHHNQCIDLDQSQYRAPASPQLTACFRVKISGPCTQYAQHLNPRGSAWFHKQRTF